MKIGIITGATGGLGKELVYETEKQFNKLDQIWVLGRNKMASRINVRRRIH